MEYNDLLKAHLRFGTTKEDIINKRNLQNLLENVVIAPWWNHTMFDNYNFKVEQIGDKIFNFYRDDISFSYIELKGIGAPVIMDYVLSLGVTKCKNLLFIGSVGSLDNNIKIGDLVVPEYSICGDGAARYLNDNLEDELFKKEYPSKDITNKLLDILKRNNVDYHYVPNFCTDSIFAQFYHVDKILELGSKTIEMETACLFKCASILDLSATALFCVSDSTVANKSVYSGRTEEEQEHRHKVRYDVMPNIIIELFKEM